MISPFKLLDDPAPENSELEYEVRKDGEWVMTTLELSDAIATIDQSKGNYEIFKISTSRRRIMNIPRK